MNDLVAVVETISKGKGATALSCAFHPVLSKSRVCEDIRITFFLTAHN